MSGFIRSVWLECREDGQFITESVYSAWDGFRLMGVETVPFPKGMNIEVTPETAVVGYIGTVRKALQQLGVDPPHVDTAPERLREFFGRKMWRSTLGEVRAMNLDTHQAVFIKPVRHHKLFTGHVVAPGVSLSTLMETASYPDDVEVLCSQVVNFVSEYRGFVLNRELIGFRHYNGSFREMPMASVADRIIEAFGDEAPAAYSIDLGLTDTGQTLLVEINDAFSLGGYGLRSIPYAKMVEARWCEMVGLKNDVLPTYRRR